MLRELERRILRDFKGFKRFLRIVRVLRDFKGVSSF